jgi:hypothetical protein
VRAAAPHSLYHGADIADPCSLTAQALAGPVETAGQSSRKRKGTLPKQQSEKDLINSSKKINEAGTHKTNQLDEALAALKANQPPSMTNPGWLNIISTEPYSEATKALRNQDNINEIQRYLQTANDLVDTLAEQGRPDLQQALQHTMDLEKVASWTDEKNDPHQTAKKPEPLDRNQVKDKLDKDVRSSFFYNTQTIKKGIAEHRYDPKIREAEIARLENEYGEVKDVLSRHPLPPPESPPPMKKLCGLGGLLSCAKSGGKSE